MGRKIFLLELGGLNDEGNPSLGPDAWEYVRTLIRTHDDFSDKFCS